MEFLNLLQWPAMVIMVMATWLVASQSKRRRAVAFWSYLVANALWVAWGVHDGAYALVISQFLLAALNIRGVRKNEKPEKSEPQDLRGDAA
jgi:hypothetical protein